MAWKKNAWGESLAGSERASVPTKPSGRRARIRGLIAGLLVVCGALAVWFCLMPRKGLESPEGAESVAQRQSAPKVLPKRTDKPRQTVPTTNGIVTVATAKPEEPAKPAYEKKPGQLQLPNGKILTFPAPKEGETRKVYAYGHTYECDHEGNFRDISERKLFKTAFEANFLALAAQNKAFIPAFLTGLDEADVKKMLTKPYEPIGDETEAEKEKLKAYDQMRTAALEYMAQGGSFDEFVGTFASFAKKERETRAVCLREVMTLYKQGKVAEAKEMLAASDIMTEKQGYKPIRIPPHVQEAFDKLP